ncbi:MAG: hypothetical protein JWL72_1191 [Ilumatobacteraceae bacterium]|nr:hypothetical protein [Ilumatobacteraceae bacterium]
MRLLDRVVAGLGGLLLVCVVVWFGGHLIRPALPGLLMLLVLMYVFRIVWRGFGRR